MSEMLNEAQATKLVEDYMKKDDSIVSTQEILDSGAVPMLQGYRVQPGKVSDSIYGGQGHTKDGEEFENPALVNWEGTPLRLMVRTQRISTHDINRGEIPFKDQILATNHNFMRRLVINAIGTSQYDIEDLADNSVVIAAENLKPIEYENVMRAFMAKSSTSTSLYQHFMKGSRSYCGHTLPEDLVPNGPLPFVMDTPSTKSDEYDKSVSPEFLFDNGICTPEQYAQIRNGSLVAFGIVSQFLKDKGLILVDTKTEHGVNQDGKIVSMDELYTMDSSRFWMLEDYYEQLDSLNGGDLDGLNPRSFSKEFARGLSKGDEGYTDEQRIKIAVRYILGIQNLLGQPFRPDMRSWEERVVTGLETVVNNIVR